ncbi:SGF29 tudor-like domain-containing protein [Amylocystis lapponica]|nr:SGF29 tudor-like domain-containing protein [Amylocystis lapponica]
MTGRRAVSKRPASSEEVECWSNAASSLSKFSTTYSSPSTAETIGRVNRLLLAWPMDDTMPAEGYDSVRSVYKKLISGLTEIKSTAERDVEEIDNVLEQLGILVALRNAPEINAPEKRIKRPRAHSPTAAPTIAAPPVANPTTRAGSITVPPRNSVGPQPSLPFPRESKARRLAFGPQLPLQPGRKVAFHPPQNTTKAADAAAAGKEEDWILAVVTKCINQDKNRYEVQDPEPQDDGQPGKQYNTTIRSLIPIPDPSAPPDSPAHPSAYPEFSKGAIVLALYPDTSCFYRAEVLASPKDMKDMQLADETESSSKQTSMSVYKLKFEDDDDLEHIVASHVVVAWPNT